MPKLKLDESIKHAVVKGFSEFVETVDLDRYACMKPNDGRVIIKQFNDNPEENVSEGGIIMNGMTKDPSSMGVVVSVGDAPENPYSEVQLSVKYQPGDVVLFPENFGHNFVFGEDRETLLSILYGDIISKL